jgi:hypothetical protein
VLRVAELRDIDGEVGYAVDLAEEHRRTSIPKRSIRRSASQAVLSRADQHIELPERQETAPRICRLGLKPLLITALDITAVKRVASKYMWVHALGSSCECSS